MAGTMKSTTQDLICTGYSKVGATAGWTVGGGAVNIGRLATCPASQTAATLVVPVEGLQVGDVIEGFYLQGQIESAGNTVTLDANLRSFTVGTADMTDASVGSITQISKTADSEVDVNNSLKSGLAAQVTTKKSFYVLLTATTGASTDIDLGAVVVRVRREFTK